MHIYTDNITFDGTTHQFCQDYSLSTVEDSLAFVVVSDGCSSAEYTELGSQILCHIVRKIMIEKNMEIILNYDLFIKEVIDRANKAIEVIGISYHCLFATLLVSFVYDGMIYVYAFGDGCIALVDWNDNIVIQQIEYKKNMPFYPIYNNENDIKIYQNALDGFSMGSKSITHWVNENDQYIEDPSLFQREHFSKPTILKYDIDLYKTVAITTDGVASFVKENSKPKALVEVIKNYISFKNFKGFFVKRRVKKYTEDLFKEGFSNYDDVSVGALFMNKFAKED